MLADASHQLTRIKELIEIAKTRRKGGSSG